jgi:hypothetical protein
MYKGVNMTVKDGTCVKAAYIIKRDGKRYNSKKYSSYEEARSYVRKKLRTFKEDNLIMEGTGNDYGWLSHNNPSHSRYGFSITKTNT